MKKSSLGRRPSAARKPSDDNRKERTTLLPMRVREPSQDRLSTFSTPATSRQSQEFRTARALTLSSSSGRPSSIGGTRSRKDLRPLTDKEWQNSTVQKINQFLGKYLDGREILAEHKTVRNINQTLFIKLCNFFVQRLDTTCDFNRANYMNELPFLLQVLSYRGKVDKSQLQSIGTMHTWPSILGILHFLYELAMDVSVCEDMGWKLMHPEDLFKDEEEDDENIDIKTVIPHLCEIFHLEENLGPTSEECLRAKEALLQTVKQDNGFDDALLNEFTSIQEEKTATDEKLNDAICKQQQLESQLAVSQQEITKKEEEARELTKKKDLLLQKKSLLVKECEELRNFISYLEVGLSNKTEVKERLLAGKGSKDDYESSKEMLIDVSNELKTIQQNIANYSEKVCDSDMKLLNLKNEIEKHLNSYNDLIAEMMATGSIFLKDTIIHDSASEAKEEKFELCESNLLKAKQAFIESTEEAEKSAESLKKEISELEKTAAQLELNLDSAKASSKEVSKQLQGQLEKLQSGLDSVNKQLLAENEKESELIANNTELKTFIPELENLIERYQERITILSEKLEIFMQNGMRRVELIKGVARKVLSAAPEAVPADIMEIAKLEWEPLPDILKPDPDFQLSPIKKSS